MSRVTSSSTTTAPSEFAATPSCLVVHDPATAGALDRLADVPAEELKDRCLFAARPEPVTFAAQHAALVAAVEEAGIEVVRLADVVADEELRGRIARSPNQVYTRDAAITLPWLPGRYIGASMRVPLRRPEAAVLGAGLRALGLRELFAPPPGCFLEGGNVIPLEIEGRRALLVGVRLAEWRMNLDGVLVPVADDTVVAHPGSIETGFARDRTGRRPVDVLELLRRAGLTAVEVTLEEATAMQACNLLCLGARRVVSYDLCARVVDALRDRDLAVRTIPGSEL